MVQSFALATQTHDDAFREIQLNGKQLVFLFMVATVVSVVIFLCGVFVGRGVRAERAVPFADASTSAPITTPDVAPAAAAVAAPAADPSAAPPPAVDELSYFSRLEQPGQPAEELKGSAAKASRDADRGKERNKAAVLREPDKPVKQPDKETDKARGREKTTTAAAVPVAPATPASAAAAPAPAPVPVADASSAAFSEPKSSGFALQVTALRERGEAEAVAKRLSSKGYAAYVMTPSVGGAPQYYRVRIGKFQTRREAEDIAAKLQKEEQIKPWITR